MVRKKSKRALGILSASLLAMGLIAGAAGCDDSTCEGDDCTSAPVTSPTDNDDDDGVLDPACERVCGHVFGDCGDNNRIADGSPVDDEQCVIFCDGLTDFELGCLTGAPCESMAELCLGGERPDFDPQP